MGRRTGTGYNLQGTRPQGTTVFDLTEFYRSRCEMPWEQRAPLQGKFAAWSPDGKQIFFVADTRGEVYAEMNRRGAAHELYICDYIDHSPEVLPPEGEIGQSGAA